MGNSLDLHNQPEFFDNEQNIQKHLAEALTNGRLRLVLGAGVSVAINLPDWTTLIERIAKNNNCKPMGKDEAAKSSWLLRKVFNNNRENFAKAIQCALYENYSTSLPALTSKKLLIALSALSMPSRRGSVSEIITFNFDNLFENYLEYLGFSVQSTVNLPRWSGRHDVEVLHIHGLLPSDFKKPIPRNIVFTEKDFDDVVGDRTDDWRKRVEQVMQSNFCIFIGLSGNDPNLRSILNTIGKSHVSSADCPYWGVRFSSNKNDPRKEDFKENGIHQITIDNEDIPNWLLTVTQKALLS